MSMLLSKALKGITRTVSDNGTTTQRSSGGEYSGGRSRGRGRGRGGRRGNPRGGSNYNPRSRFDEDDEDVSMAGVDERSQRRYVPYQRPRGGNDRRGNVRGRRDFGGYDNRGDGGDNWNSNHTWSKVSIPHGTKHDSNWLINKLQRHIDMTFQPSNLHVKGDLVMFFVEDMKVADALRKANNCITVKDGSKISIFVKPSPPPKGVETSKVKNRSGPAPYDEPTQQIYKESLSQRYDLSTHTMNLSDYYHDPVLNANNMKGLIAKHWVMETVLKVIQENCPEVRVLDLSNNRIAHLDSLKELGTIAPGITELKLGNNQIQSINELEKLKSSKNLVTLDLNGNPLCDNYQDQDSRSYISDVRNFLPKVQVLDGQQLPPPIAFDLPSDFSLPKPQGSYLGKQPQIKDLVLQFLQQYYLIYDSDDRKKLLKAYHDDAIFSLSINQEGVYKESITQKSAPLKEYVHISRNLKKVSDHSHRFSLLKHSCLSVVAFLNELPATKHDLDQFTVDITLELPTCLSFTVNGVFIEGDKKLLRAFTRVFIAVPANGGTSLTVVNDQLHIRHPTQAQHKTFLQKSTQLAPSTSTITAETAKVPQAMPATMPGPSLAFPAPSPVVPTLPQQPMASPQQQQQLVQRFSQESGMNSEYSMKCLAENEWNYDKAAQVFVTLQSKGTIPPEAFKK